MSDSQSKASRGAKGKGRTRAKEREHSTQLELELSGENEFEAKPSKEKIQTQPTTKAAPSPTPIADKAPTILKKAAKQESFDDEDTDEDEFDFISDSDADIPLDDAVFDRPAVTYNPPPFRLGEKTNSQINGIMTDIADDLRSFEAESEYWDEGHSSDELGEIASDEYWAFLASFE